MADAGDLKSPAGNSVRVQVPFPAPLTEKIKERGVSVFRNPISQTPFTGDIADAMFPNITGMTWRDDDSFVATMRAILAPRMKDVDKIALKFHESSATAYDISDGVGFVKSLVDTNDYAADDANKLIVHSITGADDKVGAMFDVIAKSFCEAIGGYERIEKVSAFYQKLFRVLCFVNPANKNTVLYIENLDTRKLHYLQVSIVAFLPWYINKDHGITEEEMQLVKSLSKPTSDCYMECLSKIASKYDFRIARIRRYLAGYEKRIEEQMIANQRCELEDIDRRIDSLTDDITRYLCDREEASIRLMGLEEKARTGSGEDSELMEYFLCNKALDIQRVSGDKIYFVVKGYLDYFDRACAERTIKNQNSFVHTGAPSADVDKNTTMLLKEIFVNPDPRLKIKVCAAYVIDIANRQLDAVKGYSFTAVAPDYMPNPHINNYRCIGNYRAPITDAFRRNDYIGVIEQCVASCSSLNWTDGTVMASFMREDMYSAKNKFIELPDGTSVSPDEAIEWLKSQEVNTPEKKEEKADE